MVVRQYICSSTPGGAQGIGVNSGRMVVVWWFGSTSALPHLVVRKWLIRSCIWQELCKHVDTVVGRRSAWVETLPGKALQFRGSLHGRGDPCCLREPAALPFGSLRPQGSAEISRNRLYLSLRPVVAKKRLSSSTGLPKVEFDLQIVKSH